MPPMSPPLDPSLNCKPKLSTNKCFYMITFHAKIIIVAFLQTLSIESMVYI